MTEPSVCAVVVTYQPEVPALLKLISTIRKQVHALVIVDNTGTVRPWHIGETIPDVDVLLRQEVNVGLARAQNIGIDWARTQGFDHVLLLDQDSIPGEGMVAALLEAQRALSERMAVAAVGPRFHDLREDRDAPFVQLAFPANKKVWCAYPDQTVECDFIISSGALISIRVIDAVGLMDASLFIDNVDVEWSFRAKFLGYSIHGVCAATMHHRLGDARGNLPLGLGRVVLHGPLRLYYMMRNRILLYKMQHTPRVWVAQDLPRVVVKLFLFGVLFGPRYRNMRHMLAGLLDGIRGRRGEAPSRLR